MGNFNYPFNKILANSKLNFGAKTKKVKTNSTVILWLCSRVNQFGFNLLVAVLFKTCLLIIFYALVFSSDSCAEL